MKAVMAMLILFTVLLDFEAAGTSGAAMDDSGVYIVYMGSPVSADGFLNNDRAQILNSLIEQRRDALIHHYRHGFSGFAARMSAEEAKSIAQQPGVVSVFPDGVYQLHTTRSWDFLQYSDVDISSHHELDASSTTSGSDIIIGIFDTGIWPESKSFSDKDMGPIPSRWKGTCLEGKHFNSSNCNKKIIGARFYDDPDDDSGDYNTARDWHGHGTHVASTAAGTAVSGVSYYGVASGTARGGSPSSRIAVYRVCTPEGCRYSALLAAFDDAIADGVDVISISIGHNAGFIVELKDDPIAIGSFHAVENKIIVVCSAGNNRFRGSIVNDAPWILTVGATTIDRSFETNVVLGGNEVIKGESISLAALSQSPASPLTSGKLARMKNSSESDARNCNSYSMKEGVIKGKIVLCETTEYPYIWKHKQYNVQELGGIGAIVVNDKAILTSEVSKDFPVTVISSKDGDKIISYINSTKKPIATILSTVTVTNYKPAPTVAYFSSRGPSSLAMNILKPDIAAPGVNILAAWRGNDTDEAPKDKPPPSYIVESGTSMSAPHVSAVAAMIKSRHPAFSPAAVKSAIMTTASTTNNMKGRITTDAGDIATAFDYGAGQLSTSAPLQPGLVYETTLIDHLHFLCYYGYNLTLIKAFSNKVPTGFLCPKASSIDLISNINYPSISVSNVSVNHSKYVNRTVTNVGGDGDTVYKASIEIDGALSVTVNPSKLHFTKNDEKQTYQVTFRTEKPVKKDIFGSITWSNGKYKVRSPFVVNSS